MSEQQTQEQVQEQAEAQRQAGQAGVDAVAAADAAGAAGVDAVAAVDAAGAAGVDAVAAADAAGVAGALGSGGVAALEDVEEALRDVVDPELGINVVDLGLIYGLTVDESNVAIIDMTLTSAACPLQDVIEDQIRAATANLVSDFRVNWVWMPPWGPDKITDDGRDQLRALGFNV